MSKFNLMKASAMGALAATLALTTVPASAAERPERDRSQAQSQSRSDNRSQSRSETRSQPRAETRSRSDAPQVRMRDSDGPQASARASAVAQTRSDRDWNRSDSAEQRDSRARVEPRTQVRSAARASADLRRSDAERDQRRAEAERDQRRDAARQAYANGRSDERARDAREDRNIRGEAYRSGYRDASRKARYYDGRKWHDYNRWDHRYWRDDHRYDWYSYRRYNRSLFHIGSYYSPYHGYSYSRLSVGFRLGSLFFGSRYWINDPWHYRLPPAYGPYRWVRYYDDVLLVDIYSGEVVDVIYDFFW